MNYCICSVATGGFVTGLNRLISSLDKVGYTGGRLFYNSTLPPGSPHPSVVPYAFKLYALKEAQRQGYTSLLWLDSSMWAIKPVEPVFDYIEKEGYLFEAAGQLLGWWSTDAFLKHHNLTRDEAITYPLHSAGFTGLNLISPLAQKFLDRWFELAQDGVSFIGPWNDSGPDPRYKGHRHDMSAAGLIIHQLGMKIIPPTFMHYQAYVPDGKPTTVFFCRGI